MKLFITIARVLIGGLFVGHGTQKLFGWFGGHGLDATGEAFEGMGLKPGKQKAALAGAVEAGGGALFAAGLATPLAGAALTGTMVEAIRSVHGPKGPWATEGGWEYNAVLIAAILGIVEAGGGFLTLDGHYGIKAKGSFWALAALGAGVAGPMIVGQQTAPEPEPASFPAPAPVAVPTAAPPAPPAPEAA